MKTKVSFLLPLSFIFWVLPFVSACICLSGYWISGNDEYAFWGILVLFIGGALTVCGLIAITAYRRIGEFKL